jgi:hypothetical protein
MTEASQISLLVLETIAAVAEVTLGEAKEPFLYWKLLC